MQLKLEERNGVLIATPQVDRLDVKTVPEFREEIGRAVESHTKVILNLE
jgi:hypothetical protein